MLPDCYMVQCKFDIDFHIESTVAVVSFPQTLKFWVSIFYTIIRVDNPIVISTCASFHMMCIFIRTYFKICSPNIQRTHTHTQTLTYIYISNGIIVTCSLLCTQYAAVVLREIPISRNLFGVVIAPKPLSYCLHKMNKKKEENRKEKYVTQKQIGFALEANTSIGFSVYELFSYVYK